MRSEPARAFLAAVLLAGCAAADPPRDLDELVVRDATYLAPETMEPFTGAVFRTFSEEPTRNEIEGALVDGAWHGEIVVFHASGRVRYMGSFAHGERCGPWTENRDDVALESPLERLRSEIETLGLYPPCPPDLRPPR